jgi:HAMP domain-containing protein
LQGQLELLVGAIASAFALLFVLVAYRLDSRQGAAVARAQASALAASAALLLDGDAHAGLGENPARRLGDLGGTLELLERTSASGGTIRTLRPKESFRAQLASRPRAVQAGALEVVLPAPKNGQRKEAAYLPEMGRVLLEKECATAETSGGLSAFAPLLDSWGEPQAIVAVECPAHGSPWRRAAFLAAALVFAALLVFAAVRLARFHARRLERRLSGLVTGCHALAHGDWSSPISVPDSPDEFHALGTTLEALRARMAAQSRGEPPPPVPALAPQAGPARPRALSPADAVDFDLGLLAQQISEPARKYALSRGLAFQLVFPEGLPSKLRGHPVALFQALEALVSNGFRSTERGVVTLRISRAGEGPDGLRVRIEVSNDGPGIPFAQQPELTETLARAAEQDPSGLQDPLQLASALASSLGGQLGFESQPGQGSRFGFTVAFPQPLSQRVDPSTRFVRQSALGVGG